MEILGKIDEADPVWRLYSLMTHNKFPQKLLNEARMLCLFKGKEKEHHLNKHIINNAIALARTKWTSGSSMDNWLEGWYTHHKMPLESKLDSGTLASSLLVHLSRTMQHELTHAMTVPCKLTPGILLVFLKRKNLSPHIDCAESAVKIFHLCAAVSIPQQLEQALTATWKKYAVQTNITLERKMGKTMQEHDIGMAVLARYFLNEKISFTYNTLLTAQRIIDKEPPGSGTLDWLKSSLENKAEYIGQKKSNWLAYILKQAARPEEITEIVRNKYTEKLLLGIWET